MKTGRVATSAAALALLVLACNRASADDPKPYLPGLGEIMTLTQMRHAKLWLAGRAGNWELASYEVDELDEGFQDAVTYHPTHEGSPIPIAEAIPAMISGPIAQVRTAVRQKDGAQFARAFGALTSACNACHRATNFGFNVVTVPSGSSFSNQDFSPRREE